MDEQTKARLLEAVKAIHEFCGRMTSCDVCPFSKKNPDRSGCMLLNRIPCDWKADFLEEVQYGQTDTPQS